MSAIGHYTILQAALPGGLPENIGVLLVDDAGSAHVKIRRDLRSLADEDDAEYLEALQFDLRQKALELGGSSLMAWLTENASNFIQVSDIEETAVSWPEADLRRLYSEHVQARILPFETHLPQYTLAAAAGKWGERMEVEPEGWVEAPEGLRMTDDMFVAHVTGHSMEPRIPAGSLCVFRADVAGSRQGKLVLVENYGEAGENRYTIKRYRSFKQQDETGWRHERIVLEPLNPDYDAWDLDENASLRVVAEFVRVLE
jgi:SOS-response transcriptional repressor LexA